MDNSLKVIFTGNDKDTVYLPIKEGAETNNALFGLIEDRELIEKITFPKDLPKDIKAKVFPILESTVANLFDLKLTESEVDVWVKGGFGSAIEDHFAKSFMKTKGLDYENEKDIEAVKGYLALNETIKEFNNTLSKTASKVGFHWHTVAYWKVDRKDGSYSHRTDKNKPSNPNLF